MKFGALYSYWGHEWKCDYIETAKRMHACGCEVLEVGAPHLLEMTDDQLKELKTTCDELEMEITSNIGPSKEYDLASEDPAVRANGVKYLTDILRAMKKIGSKSLVGAMYSYWPCKDFKYDDKEGAWERSIQGMKEVAKVAEELDIECCLEVLNRFETYIMTSCEEAVEYCKRVGSKNVNILLDTFHMNIEEDDIEQSIEKAADYIGYFHVSEPNRKVPNTCAHINWKAIGNALKKTGYDGAVVLEPFYKFGGEQGHNMRMWRNLDKDLSMENRLRIAAQGIEYIKTQFEEGKNAK